MFLEDLPTSELDLLLEISDAKGKTLLVPVDSCPGCMEDLVRLKRRKLVRLTSDPEKHPGYDLWVLTYRGEEVVEARKKEIKNRSKEKAYNARLVLYSAFLTAVFGGLVAFVFDRWPLIVSFLRSLLHR